MNDAGLDNVGFAPHSFRSGMACTVVEKQGNVISGQHGVHYADALLENLQAAGRWTNTEWVLIRIYIVELQVLIW